MDKNDVEAELAALEALPAERPERGAKLGEALRERGDDALLARFGELWPTLARNGHDERGES